jgi:hypothetical protein
MPIEVERRVSVASFDSNFELTGFVMRVRFRRSQYTWVELSVSAKQTSIWNPIFAASFDYEKESIR